MTAIRQQYLKIKRSYPEAIVFFRLGDFYETFDEDARIASKELEIVLTSREMGKGQKVPMAGIPYHAVDSYLARLVGRGYKVAICEQMTPPSSRGIVQRDVVRVVTPGTVVEPGLLDGKTNNYLVAFIGENDEAGIAFVDITTGEFATTQLSLRLAPAELERLHPVEILAAKDGDLPSAVAGASVTRLEEPHFELETTRRRLLDHFGVATLEGYGCAQLPLAIRAAGAIIHYLGETQKVSLGQLTRLSTYSVQSFMTLDAQTRRNLDIFPEGRETSAISLLSVIDLTKTAMGGRLLKKWLGQPLLDLTLLEQRLDAVEWFSKNTLERTKVISLLNQVSDLERVTGRIRSGMAIPRELVSLRRSLEALPQIRATLETDSGSSLSWLTVELKPCQDVVTLVAQAITEEPGASPGEGTVIKDSFSPELDNTKLAAKNARQFLANLERQERERTGIRSLKVGYNKVFGYYIEVSRSNLPQVPAEYIRKQTLTEAERFFTPELKEFESTILNAQERLAELETALFRQVCQQIGASGERLLSVASALAQIDVFAALAEVAVHHRYVRPRLNSEDKIVLTAGRHPVVEQALGGFIPNDTYLSNRDAQLVVLTGPNMAGKSTYLRQVALIVLLAQIGSFVPADAATIGLVDRIFTRIGLRDELARGQSTFMVEMVETANILNNATPRSLIILDEIGRGTSTYDGISIARAVAEYIHNHPRLGAKTLFATHYHEMVELAGFLPKAKNFNVAVVEEEGKVIFLRKIVPGGADKSYGIHVAQLAGLPRQVVNRAREVLAELEGKRQEEAGKGLKRKGRRRETVPQLPLFGQPSPILEELAKLDLDSLTPLEALTRLYELQKKAKEERG